MELDISSVLEKAQQKLGQAYINIAALEAQVDLLSAELQKVQALVPHSDDSQGSLPV